MKTINLLPFGVACLISDPSSRLTSSIEAVLALDRGLLTNSPTDLAMGRALANPLNRISNAKTIKPARYVPPFNDATVLNASGTNRAANPRPYPFRSETTVRRKTRSIRQPRYLLPLRTPLCRAEDKAGGNGLTIFRQKLLDALAT